MSTHVLDTVRGLPAVGVPIRLESSFAGGWRLLAVGRTDDDGRMHDGRPAAAAPAGLYRVKFDTASYFADQGVKEFFYPEVVVCFAVSDPEARYHVPLLLSPFAYSTYRGS
ncbi:MAG: hydroxyisourate hydrolase [Catenulispora sp.]|nr:hydroxyisourate hydrolase [Catenulispora sp.]